MERLLGFTYTKPSVAPINGVWDEMWQGTAEAGGGGRGLSVSWSDRGTSWLMTPISDAQPAHE